MSIFEMFPDFNTMTGFFFYSMGLYAFIVFMGWLAQPVLDESVSKEIQQNRIREKGQKARDR